MTVRQGNDLGSEHAITAGIRPVAHEGDNVPPGSTRGSGVQRIRRVPSTPTGSYAVTVLIPSYNYARYLPDSVQSALSQRDVDVRVLVLDDASTDETPVVTEHLAAGDSRVTVVRNATNKGHLPTVNAALEMISTDYFVKLDADDLLAPGSVARSMALMEANPGINFVYGLPVHFTGTAPVMSDRAAASWTVWQGQEWFARRCQRGDNVISQPEVLMRTDAVRRVAPIREQLPHTSDMHLWLQLAATGDVGRVNGPPQGYYREHDQSMQRTVHAGVLFGLRARREAFDSVFESEGRLLAGSTMFHSVARQALANEALDLACRTYDQGREEDEPVEALIGFAVETYAAADGLPKWQSLQRRIRSGGPISRRLRYVTGGARRRVSWTLGHRRWERTGEW